MKLKMSIINNGSSVQVVVELRSLVSSLQFPSCLQLLPFNVFLTTHYKQVREGEDGNFTQCIQDYLLCFGDFVFSMLSSNLKRTSTVVSSKMGTLLLLVPCSN